MVNRVPRLFFLVKGNGKHKEKLASFETALKDAGISQFNLVRVSSIVPPRCRMITREQGLKHLHAGEIVNLVLAQNETNEPRRLMAASIGIAIPAKKDQYGYLSEHHSFGETDKAAGDYAEDLAASMLATTMGIPFDVNQAWNERERVFKASGQIIKTANITQSAMGERGVWTTVVAGAVFVFLDGGLTTVNLGIPNVFNEFSPVHLPPTQWRFLGSL